MSVSRKMLRCTYDKVFMESMSTEDGSLLRSFLKSWSFTACFLMNSVARVSLRFWDARRDRMT